MRLVRVLGLLLAAVLALGGCGGAGHGGRAASAPQSDLGDSAQAANGAVPQAPVVTPTPGGGATGGEPEVGVGGRGGSCAQPSNPMRDMPGVQQSTLCLLNAERSARGLPPLRSNAKLARAATRHSLDMVRRRYFAHDTRGGGSFDGRVRAAGYLRGAAAWAVGENIAWGSGVLASPKAIVLAWMNSPPHRANILNRSYREIGLGMAVGSPKVVRLPGLTYTTDFGARR